MVDQPHGNSDEQNARDERGGPEVPTRSAPDHRDAEQAAKEKQNSEREIHKRFTWLREGVWPWVIRTASNSNVWTALATVVIAISTIVYTHYAIKQWTAMNKTLGEIQKQTPEVQKQAAAAQSQWEVMQDADRPWIDVDIAITSPLAFDGKAAGTAFTFTLSNIGLSPAQNISINPRLTFATLGDDLRKVQKQACDDAKSAYGMGSLRYILFQGQHYTQAVGLDIPAKEIDSHWGKMPPGAAVPDLIPLALVGCVDYTYQSSGHHHQTAFAFDLAMKDGGIPSKSNAPISPTDLILRAHPVSGHYPN